jgi:hypothetical protein
MRIDPDELTRIAAFRYGFMIADMVLGDTLKEYADGAIDEDELAMALQQHRMAYEGYVTRLQGYVRPEVEA